MRRPDEEAREGETCGLKAGAAADEGDEHHADGSQGGVASSHGPYLLQALGIIYRRRLGQGARWKGIHANKYPERVLTRVCAVQTEQSAGCCRSDLPGSDRRH